MKNKKTDNSIDRTIPFPFSPKQNLKTASKLIQKATLSFCLFFIFCASYAQNITIVGNPTAYYCGQVITLEALVANGNNIDWQASGGISLREINTSGSGTSSLSNISGNQVEAIINGSGTVTSSCGSCSIDLTPSSSTLGNLQHSTTAFGGMHNPNNIQTTKPWICISNDGSTETITLTNPSPLNILWVVHGGAQKINQTQSYSINSGFTASVTIATTGPNAGKGFIRAFVSDACGSINCGAALDWEILKNIMPTEIAGPTCLRDNNLDASRSVVYSIPDEFAGNAVYNWELYQNGVIVPNDNLFKIRSQVLYGNSATIIYTGGVPSSVGNFTLKITNSCSSTPFYRDIIVSPRSPNITAANNNYCVSNAINTTQTVHLDPLLPGQVYDVEALNNVNWTTTVNGDSFTVTFLDGISGAVKVKIVNQSDTTCGSSEKMIYFNREGGIPSIGGIGCIQRGTTEAFSFTASPAGQYTWSVNPALPPSYSMNNSGNIFTITPPNVGGVDRSGTYTITAVLRGCSSTQSASSDFELGPEKPTITGDTCVTPNAPYSYMVNSTGAVSAVATGATVTSPSFPIGTPFNFTTPVDTTISFTTFSSTGCASLPTVVDVLTKPIVTSITSSNLCVSFNETPTITYTANTTGNVNNYNWTYPSQWTLVSGGGVNDNSITLTLDANTSGSVCLKGYNNGCDSEELCLEIPRNALSVVLLRDVMPMGPFSIASITATSLTGNPLIINFYSGATQGDVIQNIGGVDQAIGTHFPDPTLNTTPSISSNYAAVRLPANAWVSLSIVDPLTGCSRAIAVEVDLLPTAEPGGIFRLQTGSIQAGSIQTKSMQTGSMQAENMQAEFEINVYPNPVENILNVKIPTEVTVRQTYLVDAKGTIVFQSTKPLNTQTIDVSKFAKGMYYLAIITDKGIQGKKVVLK